ncbi:MAG TPA: SOS response-associated peptidase [Caulobacteraceae bacterium]|nr:SOS response-associated peptidase [Caulobacteraceae bacterium]
MCNDYRYRHPLDRLVDEFAQLKIPLRFPAGRPNLQAREDIRITEKGAVIRPAAEGSADLTLARWSWPGPTGKPVFNFRGDGRKFPNGRCLIPADGFYEFTASDEPTRKRKDKWLFTPTRGDLFAIAGLYRSAAAAGEDAWTMLTCAPGPDVAPYHDRQVVILRTDQWSAWLFSETPETELLQALPAGSLKVERAA